MDKYYIYKAQEAQLVERKTEDFQVVSSNLTLGNMYIYVLLRYKFKSYIQHYYE